MIPLANQPLPIRNGQKLLGLGAVQPVALARSLLADVGDVGDRGRGVSESMIP
jgi:hypothetical protein